jgi:hypothetical protein
LETRNKEGSKAQILEEEKRKHIANSQKESFSLPPNLISN